jgi:hypothetical protein
MVFFLPSMILDIILARLDASTLVQARLGNPLNAEMYAPQEI